MTEDQSGWPCDDPFDLSGEVAILTGGGKGIGEATAKLLAKHGADLALASRNVANLERVAAEIRARTDRKVLVVPADIKSDSDVLHLVAETKRRFDKVDILVNNAGGTRTGPMLDTPMSAFDSVLSLNLRAPFLLTREVGRHMADRRHGAIVNISSGAGQTGMIGGGPYSAAKSGLQMLTRVTAAELGPHQVRANCVAVGAVASEGALAAWDAGGLDRETLGRSAPLRRVGEPLEVAYVVLFLASQAASFITGQTLVVDGGPRLGGTNTASQSSTI